MDTESSAVERGQKLYKVALEEWVAAIRLEEDLVSSTRSVAQVDRWEQAHFREEEARKRAKTAKDELEAALRAKYFQF